MATGNTLDRFTALHHSPPAANLATLDLRNDHPVLEFDKDTSEIAYFESVLSRAYSGGGITVYIHWMSDTATSGGVVWGVSFERENTDLDSDSFASEKTATGTASGTCGIVTVTSIAFTDGAEIDSIAVGESYRIKVARKVADGSDDMACDAQLLKIEIKET